MNKPANSDRYVSLPPQLDTYVRDLVRGGNYGSASEVVREGLRLVKKQEGHGRKLEELRDLIQEGLESGATDSMTSDDIRGMIRARASELRGEVDRGERPAPGGPGSIPV